MMRLLLVAACALCAAAGCKDTEAARPSPEPTGVPRADEPAMDERTQYDLARAIDRADAAEDPEVAYDQIRRDWLGNRYRWSVYRVAPLCRGAGSCNVLPFDRGARDKQVVQGWMPRLRLEESAMKTIEAQCAGRTRCRITIEATLSEMVLSLDKPTSLAFSDVTVAGL